MTDKKDEHPFLTSDFSESAKLFLMNKIKDPRPFYFVSAWLAVNWWLVYFLMRTSRPPVDAIAFIREQLPFFGIVDLFLYPVLFYFSLLAVVPILIALGKLLYNKIQLPISYYLLDKLEPNSFVKRSEHRELMQKHSALEEEYLTGYEVREKNLKITELEDELESIKSVLEGLRAKLNEQKHRAWRDLCSIFPFDFSISLVVNISEYFNQEDKRRDFFSMDDWPFRDLDENQKKSIYDALARAGIIRPVSKKLLSNVNVNKSFSTLPFSLTTKGKELFQEL